MPPPPHPRVGTCENRAGTPIRTAHLAPDPALYSVRARQDSRCTSCAHPVRPASSRDPSNNRRNQALPQVLAARLTTSAKPALPSIVELGDGEVVKGRVCCDDIETSWLDEITRDLGALSAGAEQPSTPPSLPAERQSRFLIGSLTPAPHPDGPFPRPGPPVPTAASHTSRYGYCLRRGHFWLRDGGKTFGLALPALAVVRPVSRADLPGRWSGWRDDGDGMGQAWPGVCPGRARQGP
jgi:hypothetical protein